MYIYFKLLELFYFTCEIGSRLIRAPLCTNSIIVYFCLLVFTVESLISDHRKCENLMVAYEPHWVFFFGR